MTQSPRDYWEPLWADGVRYRPLLRAETALLAARIGPGNGRPALDIGCGDGTLARYLQHELGYHTTGIDCAPSAIALAEARDTTTRSSGPAWRCGDIVTDDPSLLPDSAYAVVTCRLVYRWAADKSAFLHRVRQLLAPGGRFWVVTEIAGRRPASDPHQDLGITPGEAELLTTGWSAVHTDDLDVLRCYTLRP
ncbi:class I SAM-dependent DNA methyltransferase [Streptomyces sp. NPDC087440]|uniref:class I SAM-dependent DNA methyltransferase n=1 Tax=Streptomyces sp. NPDC087440 TaxID=3365790 RepID=UPI00382A160B